MAKQARKAARRGRRDQEAGGEGCGPKTRCAEEGRQSAEKANAKKAREAKAAAPKIVVKEAAKLVEEVRQKARHAKAVAIGAQAARRSDAASAKNAFRARRRASPGAAPARRSTACASSTSRMCNPGPTCTQLLAWFGADVIKVERPGVGDITRGQLRDVPNADSLYFTMLNHNKRSITIDSKHPEGKAVLEAAGEILRRAGREFRARRARAHGAHLRAYPRAQPAHDRGLGQGLRPGPLRGLQGL